MAYDELLAGRIRTLIGDRPGLNEKKMFGGLAFLLNGNMTIAASGQGGLLVRVDPQKSDQIIASTSAQAMIMHGKAMSGWLRVANDDLSDDDIHKWITLSTDFTSTLPKK